MSTVFAQKILNVQKQQMFIQLPTPRHRGYGQGGYHLSLRVLATCRAGRTRQCEGIQALCKEINEKRETESLPFFYFVFLYIIILICEYFSVPLHHKNYLFLC